MCISLCTWFMQEYMKFKFSQESEWTGAGDSGSFSIRRITTMFIQINKRQILCLSTLITRLQNYNS